MKQYTANYIDTFIETAPDCPVKSGVVPPDKTPKTIARQEYDMLSENPYRYTSDDIIYAIKGAPKGTDRETFFSRGQPCFRASALTRRYGWGVHSDFEGKIALYAADSDEYKNLSEDKNTKHVRAMRTGK
ncbi:MAG: DUF6157 family protein [Oscillospiraceae bacterium]|nr:DUF6157 family protein [Oscillospiraceae bacterium]